jgi:uncharacterized protein YqhQ
MRKCTIGGQAVIEGVMMRSRTSMAVSARNPQGKIESVTCRLPKSHANNLPLARGVSNLVTMLKTGINTITWSAQVAGETGEEPSAFEKKLAKLIGIKVDDLAIGLGLLLGFALFVVLFIMLPQLLVRLILGSGKYGIAGNLLDGAFRLVIFSGYLVSVSYLKDIKRVFMYHGAEHKTIACYENEAPLTPENASKYSRLHPRCGTSFLLLVMVISILVFSVFDFDVAWWARLIIRISLLPVIAGISYEILRFASKGDSIIHRSLRWPGLQLQRLTTKEPDLAMLEVAIHAFNLVLDMDNPEKAVEDGGTAAVSENGGRESCRPDDDKAGCQDNDESEPGQYDIAGMTE